jgi:hypothetical protein
VLATRTTWNGSATQGRLREHVVEHALVGGGEIERGRGDVSEPLGPSCAQPGRGRRTLSIRNDVEQLAPLYVDNRGHELLVAARSGLHHEVLVETERPHVAEALGILDESGSVGENGVIDGVPVTAEVLGHFKHGASVLADLERRPASGAVGHLQSRGGDAGLDLCPGALRAVELDAAEPSFVPDKHDHPPRQCQIHERDAAAVLHDRHDPARRATHDLAHEFDVNLGNFGLVVDAEHANALEIDKEQVHEGRVRNHEGLAICRLRETTDLQGPHSSLTPRCQLAESQNPACIRRATINHASTNGLPKLDDHRLLNS